MTAKDRYDRHGSPEALASNGELPVEERLEELADWAEDLEARLKASDENMNGGDPGSTGELLRRVHACLLLLEEQHTGAEPER